MGGAEIKIPLGVDCIFQGIIAEARELPNFIIKSCHVILASLLPRSCPRRVCDFALIIYSLKVPLGAGFETSERRLMLQKINHLVLFSLSNCSPRLQVYIRLLPPHAILWIFIPRRSFTFNPSPGFRCLRKYIWVCHAQMIRNEI